MPIGPLCKPYSRASKTLQFATLERLIGAVLFGGTALVVLHDWVGIGGAGLDVAINGVVYDAVVVCAGLACLPAGRRAAAPSAAPGSRSPPRSSPGRPARSGGRSTSKATPTPPIPRPPTSATSPSTRWPCSGSTCWCARGPHELDPRLWMDGAIAALGTGALGAALLFEFVADRTSGTGLEVATTLAYPFGDVRPGLADRRRHRPHPLAARPDLDAAARRPRRDGGRRRRLHPADLRSDRSRRRLGRTDLPDLGRPARRRGLAAARPIRILPDARFDGWREMVVPGIVAVAMIALVGMQYFNARQRPDHGALVGDDAGGDRPAGAQPAREQAPAGAGPHRPR